MYEYQNSNHMLQKGYTGEPSPIQKSIDQVGLEAVYKSLGHAATLGYCDVHGHYMMPKRDSRDDVQPAGCELCAPNLPNGTTATAVEHYINVTPVQGTNPHQRSNPFGF